MMQYYLKNVKCQASSPSSPDCKCWHNVGTGPFSKARVNDEGSEERLQWRLGPDVIGYSQPSECDEEGKLKPASRYICELALWGQKLKIRTIALEAELKLNDEVDTDCRNLLCEERDAAERVRDIYRDELRNIANANPRNWEDPSDFKAWAQSRALFILGDK